MDYLSSILQVIVAAGILNVWILRFRQGSAYRGKSADSMPEEFAAYGLPKWFMWVVGVLKVGSALALVAGLWLPQLTVPAALLLAVLMMGALVMHVKVRDPWHKSLPAFAVLVLNLAIVFLESGVQ